MHIGRYLGIRLEENSMTTTLPYKVVDLSSHDEDWSAYLENVLLQHAAEGWELVTGFQRQHEATQVGSTTVHVPSLVSTVLIFKRVREP
jgi:hemolysin activation/secretion protein